MATKAQRVKAIIDALKDGDTSQADIDRMVIGVFLAQRPTEDPAAVAPAERLTVFLRWLRTTVRSAVHEAEIRQAEQAARQSIIPPSLGED